MFEIEIVTNRSVVQWNKMMLLRNNARFNHRQMETQTLKNFGNFPRRKNASSKRVGFKYSKTLNLKNHRKTNNFFIKL